MFIHSIQKESAPHKACQEFALFNAIYAAPTEPGIKLGKSIYKHDAPNGASLNDIVLAPDSVKGEVFHKRTSV